MIAGLRQAPNFWGVGVLVVLLCSLPLLPLDSQDDAAAAAPRSSPRTPQSIASQSSSRDDYFTYYIFDDEVEAQAQFTRIDPMTAAVILVRTPEESLLLDLYLIDVNFARQAAGLPSVIVIDSRRD
jgi:hypothetical protein